MAATLVLIGASCTQSPQTLQPDSARPFFSTPATNLADRPEIVGPGGEVLSDIELDEQYTNCLLVAGFHPGGAQVILDKNRVPVGVKTGRNVPAAIHGPCMEKIGGQSNGQSSWG